MKELLKQPLAELTAIIEAMPTRSRVMVLLAGLSVVYGIVALGVLPLMKKSQDRIDASIAATEKQATELGATLSQLVSTQERQSDAAYRAKVLALQTKKAEETARRAQMNTQLVPPTEIAALVEDLLVNNRQVELLGLKNSEPIRIDQQADAKAEVDSAGAVAKMLAKVASASAGSKSGPEVPVAKVAAQSDVGVYRHEMTIEIKGRYWDIARFLKSLEDQPRRILWGEVKLVTQEHPFSTAEITIYTLNFEPVWITI